MWFTTYFKEGINFQIQLGTNPTWCLDAGTPMKPGNQVTLWGCDWNVLGQYWMQQKTDKYVDYGFDYISYLVLADSSKNLTGIGPAEVERK